MKIALYAIVGTIFAVGVGEVFLATMIAGSTAILDHTIPLVAYYFVLSLAFGIVLTMVSFRKMLVVFFIYGVIAETFLFRNITALPGVLFFGVLYVFLFGVPARLVGFKK